MHNRIIKELIDLADTCTRRLTYTFINPSVNIQLLTFISTDTLLLPSWPVPRTYLHEHEERRPHGRRRRTAARTTTDGGRANEGWRTAAQTTTDRGRADDDGRRPHIRRRTETVRTTTEDGRTDEGGKRTGR
jgi:hypothetical protein